MRPIPDDPRRPSWRRRLATAFGRRDVVHLLHVGKTGGTALADAFDRLNARADTTVRFEKHGHKVKRWMLPPGAPFLFAVRDPIERFYSGFYSRKRKGRPRTHVEWTPGEARAFDNFPEADDLARSLFTEGERGARALDAMRSIRHVRDFQLDWFDDVHALFHDDPPLVILRQERLAADFAALLELSGLPTAVTLPTDDVRAHKNDYRRVPPLGEEARTKLARWYAADLQFVAMAEAWMCHRLAERTDRAEPHG